MNPSLFAAAIAAVFILGLRRGQTRGASTKPSPSPPEGEGSGEPPAPPKPRPRPGKDFAVGGFKSAGGGGGGGGGGAGGGIVFEPGGGGQDPEPEPEPEPFNAVPAFQHLPAPIEWEAKIGNVDDSHEVQLSEQEKKRLPDGEYYAKLSLDVRMTAPQIRDNGHGTWVWNNANIVWYGQIETITYRMIVSGDAAVVQKVKQSQKKVGAPFVRYMFNCPTAESCGWNGTYFSFFSPELVWDLGLEARFKTRKVLAEGINLYQVKARVVFSWQP